MLMTLQLTDGMRNIQLGSHYQQQPQPPQFNASQIDPMAASSSNGQFSGLGNLPHSAMANPLHQFNMSGFNPMLNQQQPGIVSQPNQFNNQQQMSNLMPSTDQARQQLQHLAQQQQQQRAQLARAGDASFQQQQVCSLLIIVSVPYAFVPTKRSSPFLSLYCPLPNLSDLLEPRVHPLSVIYESQRGCLTYDHGTCLVWSAPSSRPNSCL